MFKQVERIHEKEYTRLTREEQERYVEDYFYVAERQAAYFANRMKLEYDDLLSYALEGLYKATKSYVKEKGNFYAYAIKAINSRVYDLHLKSKAEREFRDSKLDKLNRYDDSVENITRVTDIDIDEKLVEIKRTLNDDETKLLDMITQEKMILEEIGQAFNLTAQGVKRRIESLKYKVQDNLFVFAD